MKMFDYLQFSNNRLPKLTQQEANYWHMIFKKILKVGEEFEVVIPSNLNVERTYQQYERDFQPSHSVHHHGKFGIKEITSDGSVPNGMELITVGKRFDWKSFYNMNKRIIDKFNSNSIYTNHHTGMHIHLLAGYTNNDITELEKPVPEIILANFYQLHRMFTPELYWIASGGEHPYAITRYMLFRKPPFDYSAITHPMEIIRDEMQERHGKYQMVNMNFCRFSNREVSTFHVEIRHPDTHLSPAYSTALVALEVALLTKAIELSTCGIISIKQDEFDYKKNIFDKFVNYGTGERESDSSELDESDIQDLQVRTNAMIRWLKSEIVSVNPVAYEILKVIAVTPSSQMRIGGLNWQKIEQRIYNPRLVDYDNISKLVEMIILQQITECPDNIEWLNQASERLKLPPQKTSQLLDDIGMERLVTFDEELGGYIFKQIV